jgi:hypothetical protein
MKGLRSFGLVGFSIFLALAGAWLAGFGEAAQDDYPIRKIEGTIGLPARATVQILLFSDGEQVQPVSVAGADGPVPVRAFHADRGLGTVIAAGENTFILTHNHWGDLEGAVRAQIRTAAGDLVAEVDGGIFRSWIRYQDAGTLMLSVPASLVVESSLQVAPWDDPAVVAPGDQILAAHQDPEHPDRVAFLQLEVVAIETESGLGAFTLRTTDGGAIVRGDSGGGVWYNGRLVGNHWKTEVRHELDREFFQTGQLTETPTGTSLAAQLPGALLATLQAPAANAVGTPAGGNVPQNP